MCCVQESQYCFTAVVRLLWTRPASRPALAYRGAICIQGQPRGQLGKAQVPLAFGIRSAWGSMDKGISQGAKRAGGAGFVCAEKTTYLWWPLHVRRGGFPPVGFMIHRRRTQQCGGARLVF